MVKGSSLAGGDESSVVELDPEDDALLLRAWQLRVGALRAGSKKPLRLRHLVIDEVQDFSALEVQDAGDDLSEIVSWGDGSVFQQTFPHIKTFVRDNLLRGTCFRHISIWPHANLLSRPDLSPPGHGSVSYCETDLVWMCKKDTSGFGMFKYFADRTYFSEPPRRIQ